MDALGTDDRLRWEICSIGQRIWQRGLVASNDGNISVRLSTGNLLCTPSQVSKGFMSPDELAICDPQARMISGIRPATSEIRLHAAAYQERTDVFAVVHTHAPHAIAASLLFDSIPEGVLAEVELALGPIPIAEYTLPGTWDFANKLRPFFRDSNAVILRHHGLVTMGRSLEQAYMRSESVDHYCRILLLAHAQGGWRRLNSNQVQELAAVRQVSASSTSVIDSDLMDDIVQRVRQRLKLS